jgi:hypothetical protein
LLAGPGAGQGTAERRVRRADLEVVLGRLVARAEQERLGGVAVVVLDGQHHARLGDPVVRRVLADDGLAQDVVDPADPGLAVVAPDDAVGIAAAGGVLRVHQFGPLPEQAAVGVRGQPRACRGGHDVLLFGL